jgi:hypothetical protein
MNRAVARTGLIVVIGATALMGWAMACGGGAEPQVTPPPNAECWRTENWPEIDRSMRYMPGQLLVGFKEGVTQAEAGALIDGYGLSFTISEGSPTGGPTALVCVRPGEEAAWVDTFEASDIVGLVSYNILGWLIE